MLTKPDLPSDIAALAEHERVVARELELLCLPAKPWLREHETESGEPLRDVVIVGAGMNGVGAAAALLFRGIHNIVVLDAAAPGREGPWVTYARMDTLRSPKFLPGPVQGIPSLTFRAWYEAQHGAAGWEALYKIPNAVWAAYLSWLQQVLSLPVSHGVSVTRIAPQDGHLTLHVTTPRGESVIHARRVVLATGRGGAGGNHVPAFIDRSLWPDRAAHGNEPIDFSALAGKSIAVVGGSASAWDNAATALEQGAGRVDMYIRRTSLPQINKGRGSANPGFFHGWSGLDLAQRWALAVYLNDRPAPPPHETVLRGLRHKGLHVHLGHGLTGVRRTENGLELDLRTDRGAVARAHDFLIVGTGFAIDIDRVPELADIAPDIARWGDVYTPPPDLRRPELSAYPFLGPGFELTPRSAGAPPELSRIHLLNHGAAASHGAIASDIPGAAIAAERLATAIAGTFFREDIAEISADLEAFDEPELETTPFFVPRVPTA
jgi:cation diffusion facilitator CzcD-associated flavoprotein CzcO